MKGEGGQEEGGGKRKGETERNRKVKVKGENQKKELANKKKVCFTPVFAGFEVNETD